MTASRPDSIQALGDRIPSASTMSSWNWGSCGALGRVLLKFALNGLPNTATEHDLGAASVVSPVARAPP